MPLTTISWLSEDTAPRTSVGAISDRYSGTTSAAEPTPKPITMRAAIRTATVGANAARSDPAVNTTAAMMMSRRRPRRSDSRPARAAPIMAPSSRPATIAPCRNGPSLKVFGMNRSAPEMTPVS